MLWLCTHNGPALYLYFHHVHANFGGNDRSAQPSCETPTLPTFVPCLAAGHTSQRQPIRVLNTGGEAGPSGAGSHDHALLADTQSRWQDAAVQQCLKLCSSVDLVYKLLIQDIQPVLGECSLQLRRDV